MESIPTGSLSLDLALGIGGLPRGRIVAVSYTHLDVYKRQLLRRQTATLYAGELNDAAAYYGMDEDVLRRSFSLIVGSGSN